MEDKLNTFGKSDIKSSDSNIFRAPFAGTCDPLHVKPGYKIRRGQEVCVINAMKMENKCVATKGGIIKQVFCKVGSFVQADTPLYELEPSRDDEEATTKGGDNIKEDELSDDEEEDEHDHNWDDVGFEQKQWTI